MSWKNGGRGRRLVACLRCGRTRLHEARSLCRSCYTRLQDGRLHPEHLDLYPLASDQEAWTGITAEQREARRAA